MQNKSRLPGRNMSNTIELAEPTQDRETQDQTKRDFELIDARRNVAEREDGPPDGGSVPNK